MTIDLRSIVSRYKKDEILSEVSRLDCVVKRRLQLKSCVRGVRSKPEIITAIVKKLESLQEQDEHILDDVAAELDLNFLMKRGRSKQWTLFQFMYPEGSNGRSNAIDPGRLRETLLKKLRHGFKVHCIYKLKDGTVWLRMALCDRSFLPEKTAVMYAAHQLRSSSVIATKIVINMRNAIFSIFSGIFRLSNIRETELTGKCPRSLIRIANDTDNHGRHSHNSQQNSLVQTSSTKRKAQQEVEVPHVTSLQQAEKRQRRDYTDNIFGVNEQPLLQTLKYTLETDFCGFRNGSELERKLFHCQVTFSGPSVLEGLRELVTAGVATCPLPKTLRNIRSSKRNKWKITNARR